MDINTVAMSEIAKGWPHYRSVILPYGRDQGDCDVSGDDTSPCEGDQRQKTPLCPPGSLPESRTAQERLQAPMMKTALMLLMVYTCGAKNRKQSWQPTSMTQ